MRSAEGPKKRPQYHFIRRIDFDAGVELLDKREQREVVSGDQRGKLWLRAADGHHNRVIAAVFLGQHHWKMVLWFSAQL